MNLYANYKVGLVMPRSGVNDAQRIVLRSRLQEIAKMGGAEPNGLGLFVPAALSHGDRACGPTSCALTEELVAHVTKGLHWINVTVLDVGPLPALLDVLRECDEVWCATASGGSESMLRPARLHALAQKTPVAARFKLLHYWVEPPPESVPSQDTRKPKALKGW